MRLLVGLIDEDVPLHADRTPPENSGFGCAGLSPRLASAFLKVSMLALAAALGPSVTKCSPSSPAQAEPSSPDEPYQNGGNGFCSGLQRDRHVLVFVVRAFVGERVGGQALESSDRRR